MPRPSVKAAGQGSQPRRDVPSPSSAAAAAPAQSSSQGPSSGSRHGQARPSIATPGSKDTCPPQHSGGADSERSDLTAKPSHHAVQSHAVSSPAQGSKSQATASSSRNPTSGSANVNSATTTSTSAVAPPATATRPGNPPAAAVPTGASGPSMASVPLPFPVVVPTSSVSVARKLRTDPASETCLPFVWQNVDDPYWPCFTAALKHYNFVRCLSTIVFQYR